MSQYVDRSARAVVTNVGVPRLVRRAASLLAAACLGVLAGCGGGGGGGGSFPPPVSNPQPSPPVAGPAWPMFSRDAQHAANSAIATPSLNRILWQTPVDLAQQLSGGFLLAHYGSPVISSMNTVLVPVKTTAQGGFRVEARAGGNGVQIWSANSDYVVPPHGWFPSFNVTITPNSRMYMPGAGGKLIYRDNVDSATGTPQTVVFYGDTVYANARAEMDVAVKISTPITTDAAGNVWFGFYVDAANVPNSANLRSGVARISATGVGTWQAAATLANDAAIDRVAMNSAPALSADGNTLYVAVANAQDRGYLLALDSATLAPIRRATLLDPRSGALARIEGDGTASPVIGPDGDVYFGVLEAGISNNARGWLLHFNSTLTTQKIPGAFGWDNSPTVIPASAVPQYLGPSTYLLATKYNNYAGVGTGNGQNRMAILDPFFPQTDPISGITTMNEVITILGPTPDASHPGGVREWCVNTGAFDPATRSMLINNEDGKLYRWNLATNTLSQSIQFNNGLGQSYTPTAVGADGTVYAINNSVLFAVGQ